MNPELLRIVVTTRWSTDGASRAVHSGSSPVVKTWEKSRRRGETDATFLARVRADASWYIDTPSPYYAGSTVEIQRRDDCHRWEPIDRGSEVEHASP